MAHNFKQNLRDPHLFETNSPGAYQHACGEDGSPRASGILTLSAEGKRSATQQRLAGGSARRDAEHPWGSDDGGHLIGFRFGGSSEPENLIAQSRNLNRSSYHRLENRWAALLKKGVQVYVNIETQGGARPNALMGYAIYEYPDGTRDWESFSYQNESQRLQDQWQQDVEAADAVPEHSLSHSSNSFHAPKPHTTNPSNTGGSRTMSLSFIHRNPEQMMRHSRDLTTTLDQMVLRIRKLEGILDSYANDLDGPSQKAIQDLHTCSDNLIRSLDTYRRVASEIYNKGKALNNVRNGG